jgi:hypothetical protein
MIRMAIKEHPFKMASAMELKGLPHFNVPLNLPHAATVATRLLYHLNRLQPSPGSATACVNIASELSDLLRPYKMLDENPPPEEARAVAAEAAVLARKLVDAIEDAKFGDDRLGQAIRNLFECLELGEEGARQSLRAGENPDSVLRATE